MFNETVSKVLGFITAYQLYIRMKMRGAVVKEQIQQVLSYVQRGLVNVWKENMLEDLEGGLLEYENIGEFLADIRKEFGGGDKKSVKVVELRRLEQEEKTMKEFVQEFRRAARGNRYEGRSLVEEFKRGINAMIYQRLIESEQQPESVKQQYDRPIALDRNQRKSKREEEQLRGRQEQGALTSRQQMLQPQVWPKRQEMPQKRTIEPALMERVERTDAVIIHPQQRVGGI